MRTLIDDLLALATEGESPDDLGPVELSEVARRCWRTVETAEATLVTDGDCTVRADDGRLQRLFENVFGNAVQHGGEDVTVTVGTLADGFYVADDGAGIPEDRRDEVFEAGFSTDDESTGIGLSIVRRVAESHGWDVSVAEDPSGGARVEVTDVSVVDG